jgi:phosphoribosylanthranilate isomerase
MQTNKRRVSFSRRDIGVPRGAAPWPSESRRRHKMKIKVCGITNKEDYKRVVAVGADYVGFIFYSKSSRNVEVEEVERVLVEGAPAGHRKVGVFVNEEVSRVREVVERLGLDVVQLHGEESPGYVEALGVPVWKAIRVKDEGSLEKMERYRCEAILLDAYRRGQYGGTGMMFSPGLVEKAVLRVRERGIRIIAAGGITAGNIGLYFGLEPQPYAVDVNSGVEERPGKKSLEKLKEFFKKIKEYKRI